MILVALAVCTAIDVISILKKMRMGPDFFNIETYAEPTNEHPKHYSRLHLKYIFKGKDLAEAKINKAVNLSQERYCGVSHMLRQAAELTHEIVIEEN